MPTEENSYRRIFPIILAFSIGAFIELLVIPFPGHNGIKPVNGIGSVFRTEAFYYCLSLPFAVFFFFRVLLPRYKLSRGQLIGAYIAFGAYCSSALQALAKMVYFAIHLTGH